MVEEYADSAIIVLSSLTIIAIYIYTTLLAWHYAPYSVRVIKIAMGLHGLWFWLYCALSGWQMALWPLLSLLVWMTGAVLLCACNGSINRWLSLLAAKLALSLLWVVVLPPFIWWRTQDGWLFLHVLFSVLALSLALIGVPYTLAIKWLEARLRIGRPVVLQQFLPSLLEMERGIFILIWCGFATLCAAMISGFYVLNQYPVEQQGYKILITFIAWMILSVLLWGHHLQGWRGLHVTSWITTVVALLFLVTIGFQSLG